MYTALTDIDINLVPTIKECTCSVRPYKHACKLALDRTCTVLTAYMLYAYQGHSSKWGTEHQILSNLMFKLLQLTSLCLLGG